MPPREDAIVITGMGALTSVGNDAVQSASAVRASVVRFANWEPGGGADEGDAGLVAAALPGDLGDAPWVEKAAELAQHPVHEALWQAELFDFAEIRRTRPRTRLGAYVAAPNVDRPGVDKDAYRLFAVEAQRHCIAPAQADEVKIITADHAAGGLAIAQAMADLRAGQVDFAVVGGLDSLLHSVYLRVLLEEGRLKSPETPAGLIPGEAAAVVVLERAAEAAQRGAKVLGLLGNVATEREPEPHRPAAAIEGKALSRAVARAIEQGGGAARFGGIVTDLNGERWRSLEWALVETRTLGGLAPGWEMWHPADCVGDIGAATGVFHLVLALRAFARGYGGTAGTLMTAASVGGERVVVSVFPEERTN